MAVTETKKSVILLCSDTEDAAKHLLPEAMIYLSGDSDRLEKVSDGNTVLIMTPRKSNGAFAECGVCQHNVERRKNQHC